MRMSSLAAMFFCFQHYGMTKPARRAKKRTYADNGGQVTVLEVLLRDMWSCIIHTEVVLYGTQDVYLTVYIGLMGCLLYAVISV